MTFTQGPCARPGLTVMQANALMLLAALAWGSGNVSQKLILEHLDPFAANGLTCLIGAAALSPLVRREAGQSLPPLRGRWGVLMQAAAAFTIAATLMQVGYGLTTVTNAGFLANLAAVLTPIVVWAWYGQRPVLWIWPASLCSLLGVFLMGGGGFARLALGDVLCILAACVFTVWTLLVGRFVTATRRPALLTVSQLLVCGVASIVVGAVVYGLPSMAAVLAAWPEILFLGLVSKGAAYGLMAAAQAKVSATIASILVSAEAVVGAVAAGIFLGEAPGWMRLSGAGLLIIGVTIAAMIPVEMERHER
jgi:drug/metabolite transporter (DMT)-like permease